MAATHVHGKRMSRHLDTGMTSTLATRTARDKHVTAELSQVMPTLDMLHQPPTKHGPQSLANAKLPHMSRGLTCAGDATSQRLAGIGKAHKDALQGKAALDF